MPQLCFRLQSSLLLIACIAVALCGGAASGESQQSEAPAPVAGAATAANAYRILFIGNSITRHGTSPTILANLKWDHVSGMAASSEDKDFVHLLTAKIQAVLPNRTVTIRITSLVPGGLGTPAERISTTLDAVNASNADLVVFQHGEHERSELGADAVGATYNAMLDKLQQMPSKPKIVCVGNWALGFTADKTDYEGWTATVEHTMRDICAKRAIPFVSVAAIAALPECHGTGEHPGVKWHPNDAGHAKYADAIFDTVKPLLPSASASANP